MLTRMQAESLACAMNGKPNLPKGWNYVAERNGEANAWSVVRHEAGRVVERICRI